MATHEERVRSELLLLKHRAGDERALPELVSLWERPLFYYIRRLVDSEEDAWDILQEVWCRIIQKILTLRNPAALPSWLYAIARNTASNHRRRAINFGQLSEADVAPNSANDSTETSFSGFGAEELHRALEHLSLLHREALILHFLEGFSLAEVAAIVGAPVGTVKSRLHNAKKSLRTILREGGKLL